MAGVLPATPRAAASQRLNTPPRGLFWLGEWSPAKKRKKKKTTHPPEPFVFFCFCSLLTTDLAGDK
ncbi:hypothetical protein, partial [Escherichia coli]|uniref:hypothetical protein n=1 Tax=Escherichia coli TaxID=562 RepID=UPI001BC87214